MAYISYSANGDNPLTRLLGHNPILLKNWMSLLNSFYESCDLDRALQEEVRRVVAYQVGCAYCMSHGCPSSLIPDPKTQAAVAFAKKAVQTNQKINQEDISLLKTHFNDKEIAELSAFICYGIGLARFGAILNVEAEFPSQTKKTSRSSS